MNENLNVPIIGIVGIAIGVILTNVFQFISKYIDYRISNRNRWLEDKKHTYANFLMNSNIWFRNSLTLKTGLVDSPSMRKQIHKKIDDSRPEVNAMLAMISVITTPTLVDKTEEFNIWMGQTLDEAGNSPEGITLEDANTLISRFVTKRKELAKEFRDDLS